MLSEKDQELIAIAASIAAGCQPCTTFHFRAARVAGANDEEIRQAVSDAVCVRRSATEVMARTAGNLWGEASGPAPTGCETRPLLGELISVGAAYAVNCVTNLKKHLAVARQQGATDDQILATLKIACAVKNMAGKKVEAAAARGTEATVNRSDDCGCQSDKGMTGKTGDAVAASPFERTRNRADQCGCQS